jgi:hypothetical protein
MTSVLIDIKASITLDLTEGETRALEAICGYGPEQFKKWFYKHLGTAYLQQHEKHIDTLFEKSRGLGKQLRMIDEARIKLKS